MPEPTQLELLEEARKIAERGAVTQGYRWFEDERGYAMAPEEVISGWREPCKVCIGGALLLAKIRFGVPIPEHGLWATGVILPFRRAGLSVLANYDESGTYGDDDICTAAITEFGTPYVLDVIDAAIEAEKAAVA